MKSIKNDMVDHMELADFQEIWEQIKNLHEELRQKQESLEKL